MKTNPISFGRTVKITGNNALRGAIRCVQLVNGKCEATQKEEKTLERLQKIFYDSNKGEKLHVISFNNGKTAYILSGEEYDNHSSLIADKHQQIKDAISIYGEDSAMVSLVADAEEDRYTDLAKMLVDETHDCTLRIDYDKTTKRINSLDFLV